MSAKMVCNPFRVSVEVVSASFCKRRTMDEGSLVFGTFKHAVKRHTEIPGPRGYSDVSSLSYLSRLALPLMTPFATTAVTPETKTTSEAEYLDVAYGCVLTLRTTVVLPSEFDNMATPSPWACSPLAEW